MQITPEISAMSQALTKPVTIQFETTEQAKLFRKECYRRRESLRLLGIEDYDFLKFKIIRNTLTIKVKRTNIEDMI